MPLLRRKSNTDSSVCLQSTAICLSEKPLFFASLTNDASSALFFLRLFIRSVMFLSLEMNHSSIFDQYAILSTDMPILRAWVMARRRCSFGFLINSLNFSLVDSPLMECFIWGYFAFRRS